MTSKNPFVWGKTVADGIARPEFCKEMVLDLKSQMGKSMFGVRGTGKSSFLKYELSAALKREDEGLPGWDTMYINLGEVVNNTSFVTTIAAAMREVTDRNLRQKAIGKIKELELSFGVSLGPVSLGATRKAANVIELENPELLRETLASLTKLSPHLVIAFDEFQTLHDYPVNLLPMLRTTLLSGDGPGEVSLLVSGSIKRKIKMMMEKNNDALWSDLDDVSFPDLPFIDMAQYVEEKFNMTDRKITAHGAEYIVQISGNHPKTTQRISSYIWRAITDHELIDKTMVASIYDAYMHDTEALQDFVVLMNGLKEGTGAEQSQRKALYMIADGASFGSETEYKQYGFNSRGSAEHAAETLELKGLVYNKSRVGKRYQIEDTLFASYLRSTNPYSIY